MSRHPPPGADADDRERHAPPGRLRSCLRAPKTHAVLSTYADGTVYRHETATAAQAENFAIGERRKIGRDLISRETGAVVRVVKVEIVKMGEA